MAVSGSNERSVKRDKRMVLTNTVLEFMGLIQTKITSAIKSTQITRSGCKNWPWSIPEPTPQSI
jgi:hypothetical protein